MTQTIVLDGIEELPELFASIQEDFGAIDYGQFLAAELDRMAVLHKSYFDSSRGPDGAAWKANAPRTVQQKGHAVVLRGIRGRKATNIKATKRRPGVKFARTRNIAGFRLATSLTAKSRQSFGDAIREAIATTNGGALKFGTAVAYSIYNDQGTDRIPARPHIGMSEKHLDQMTARAADYTLAELSK